jgi:hypothetical protein
MTKKRVHTGEEWARSLEKRLRQLELGRGVRALDTRLSALESAGMFRRAAVDAGALSGSSPVSGQGPVEVQVVFSAGRFAEPPAVFWQMYGEVPLLVSVKSVSVDGAVLVVQAVPDASGLVSGDVRWLAVDA